jgi:hypothetical protein
MPKRVKVVSNESANLRLALDPDGLQVKDECDFKWVEAWRQAVSSKAD